MDKKIVGRECRFAVYCPPAAGDNVDLHVIKEILHYEDGTTEPNIRVVENFKRPFWVTKKSKRNHRQKKEWEDIENLNKYESTQTDLVRSISKALEDFGFKGSIRQRNRSPYVYGADILSTAYIKGMYKQKWPNLNTLYTVAPFDVETDVVHGTKGIICATISYKDRVYTAIKRSFVEGCIEVEADLQKMARKYIGEYIDKRKITWELEIVETDVDIVKGCFNRAHLWKPDFVAIWNIDYDIPKAIETLVNNGINPASVFSDPSLNAKFHHFSYAQGPKMKVTASGKKTPIKPAAQWHTAYCPSGFYLIDAMCAYKHIRTGAQEEPSYSLDAIMDKHLAKRKLKFVEAEGFTGIEWHQFMQTNYPLEYIVYNAFDCIGMEELEENTKDLSMKLPMFSDNSDFENFKSQPRRLADKMHYWCLENKKVFGTTSDRMQDELDDLTLGLDGWIVTLPAHLVMDNGLRIILEDEGLATNIRAMVADLDVSGSYPNGECVFNMSKQTTHKELSRIEGIPETLQRRQGINLSGGHTNAVEFCTDLYGLPPMEELWKSFQRDQVALNTIVIPVPVLIENQEEEAIA